VRLIPALLTVSALAIPIHTAQSHDWYTGLMTEDGRMCCNDRDCTPVNHRYTNNVLEVEIEGAWMTVRPNDVLQTSSPDNRAHACYYHSTRMNLDLRSPQFGHHEKAGNVIRCVILPGSS
jgi:hypothetical protein